jgi:hypothetical protein
MNGNITNSSFNSIKQTGQKLTAISKSGNNLTFGTGEQGINQGQAFQNSLGVASTSSAAGAFNFERTIGSIDRTADITIKLAMKWASASANAYVRVKQAQAYIIKKAV